MDVYFHYLLAPDGTHLELASAGGNRHLRSLLGSRLDFGQGVCGTVAQSCAPLNMNDIQRSNDRVTQLLRQAGTRSYACFPLMIKGELLGTLSFGSTEREEFSPEDLEMFSLIAQQVTLATDRRRQQAYLRELEQQAAAGRMSAMLAHEINNPLESLATSLYLLHDEIRTPEGEELLQTAESQVVRLAEITRRTLETFRGSRPEARMFDLSRLAEDLRHDIRLPRDIRLQAEIDPGLCVRGVPGELRQVLFNLLLNAAQFSPPGEAVTLTLRRDGANVRLGVRDQGLGISPKTRDKLFQPFHTTRASGGTGIGLWLSRELAERNGGTLTFLSAPEIQPGTEFVLSMPLAN